MKVWVDNITGLVIVFVVVCLLVYGLFAGVLGEQDRRDGQKSHRPWLIERALNEAGR